MYNTKIDNLENLVGVLQSIDINAIKENLYKQHNLSKEQIEEVENIISEKSEEVEKQQKEAIKKAHNINL